MALLLALGLILMFIAGMIFMHELMIYKYPYINNIRAIRKENSSLHPKRWQ